MFIWTKTFFLQRVFLLAHFLTCFLGCGQVHHIVFGGTICTVGLVFNCGHLLGLLAFFLSGLPGGLDYAMLTCVKHGWMSSETEKRYNARVMVWIRSPGCLLCAYTLYVAWRYRMINTTYGQDLAAAAVALLCFVNGQYYMVFPLFRSTRLFLLTKNPFCHLSMAASGSWQHAPQSGKLFLLGGLLFLVCPAEVRGL